MDTNLLELLAEYDQYKIDGKKLSKSGASTLLKELRKSNIRRPDIVLEWGPKVLSSENYIDVWNVQEQIAIAAIELGEYETADRTISLLGNQFKNSARVRRLSGMLTEARGEYQAALDLYDTLIKEDVSNVFARKRKAAIYKARNDTRKFIEEINTILHFFPSDSGCWLELAEVYLISGDFEAGAHCYEELILQDPRNAHYHCRLAEILYSIGGPEKVLNARKHYTISLTHQSIEYNLRAVSGLLLACKTIQSLSHNAATDKKKNGNELIDGTITEHELKVTEALHQWAKDQYEQYVSKKSNRHSGNLEELLTILLAK